MSVISAGVPRALPVEPRRIPNALRGPRRGLRRAGGLPPPHRRSRRSAIDENTMLFMRGAGPKGYPGAAEVVNMRAPDYLLKRGRHRASSASATGASRAPRGSPSILNASPEAALGRRARADRDRRPGAARPQRRAGSTCWSTTPSSARAARARSRRTAATAIRSTRRRGRRSSAASSASSRPARCSSRRSSTSASPRPRASRATTTDRRSATLARAEALSKILKSGKPDSCT